MPRAQKPRTLGSSSLHRGLDSRIGRNDTWDWAQRAAPLGNPTYATKDQVGGSPVTSWPDTSLASGGVTQSNGEALRGRWEVVSG